MTLGQLGIAAQIDSISQADRSARSQEDLTGQNMCAALVVAWQTSWNGLTIKIRDFCCGRRILKKCGEGEGLPDYPSPMVERNAKNQLVGQYN